MRRRLFILFGPLFRVKRGREGREEGNLERRGERERSPGELPFRTNGVKRLSHQPRPPLSPFLGRFDSASRLFPASSPIPPPPSLPLQCRKHDINSIAPVFREFSLNYARLLRVAGNLKKGGLFESWRNKFEIREPFSLESGH